jgi:hypothetical protein
MAQHRARAAGEHCGCPDTLSCKGGMSDRVDAAIERMQPTATDPVGDSVPGYSCIEEIPSRDNAVLGLRHSRNPAIQPIGLRLGRYRRLNCILGWGMD